MPLTIFDIIVIVVVLISATLAMVRGFVREVLSVASWVAAVAAAYYFHGPLTPLVRNYVESDTISRIIAAATIFFIALILASYITTRIADFVIDSRVGAIDRILGFFFGAARGVLLVVIALWFFNFLSPTPPEWVAEARTRPILDDLGQQLVAALPDDMEAWIQSHIGRLNEGETVPTDATPPADDSTASQADPSYGNSTRESLDQLIQNSGN